MGTVDLYDVIIVGAGIAGLSAARNLADRRVAVVSPAPPEQAGSSTRAKGGIAAAIGPEDSPELHGRDTVEAGAGLCDYEAVDELVSAAPDSIRTLEAWGAGFDREADGGLALGREAAHSRDRIVHADGDRSGRAIVEALTRAVGADHDGIDLIRGEVVELGRHDGRVRGVAYRTPEGRLRGLAAPAVILATGGIGGLYGKTTNPDEVVGRGLALAYRAGATLTNLEFVQFHPTALDSDRRPLPLLTEALRGAGAELVDRSGKSIMEDYDARGALAPRDVVARAVYRERRKGRAVYLDLSPVDRLAEQFPGTVEMLRAHRDGCQPMRVPVTPAAHYHMGGVATDLDGRTTVDGLWACGEVAHTGVHGANRLASNSMLECVVFGARAGRAADAQLPSEVRADGGPVRDLLRRRDDLVVDRNPDTISKAITDRMWRSVGVERRAAGLREAARWFDERRRDLSPGVRERDAALVAELVARSAWRREESRGAHRRRDFPRNHHGWLGRIEVRRNDASPGGYRVGRPADAEWSYIPLQRRDAAG